MIGKGLDNSLTGKVGRQLKGDGGAGEPRDLARYSLLSSVTEADSQAIPQTDSQAIPIHYPSSDLTFQADFERLLTLGSLPQVSSFNIYLWPTGSVND